MKRPINHLLLAFFLALLLLLCWPPLFPEVHLIVFAPFLILAYYEKPFLSCIWLSLVCGVIIDLFSSQTRIGFHALNYVLTTTLLFSSKRHFFADSQTTVPLLTVLFSFLSTLLQAILLYTFERGLSFQWAWVGTDLLLMPLLDGVAAYLYFVVPLHFMARKTHFRSSLPLKRPQ